MSINADFTQTVWLDTQGCVWQASPQPGVERIPLDRMGAEVARATSLVRYAPGSHFPAHGHGGGEEILVLSGVFSDASGNFPAGSYLRNPPGSAHAPFTLEGCTLLVKLWQFAPDDSQQICLDTRACPWRQAAGPGLQFQLLHQQGEECVRHLRLASGLHWCVGHAGGAELFILEGALQDGAQIHRAGGWLRLAPGAIRRLQSLESTRVYLKTGHLVRADCWALRPAQG